MNLTLSLPALYGMLLVLTRVAGAFAFHALPLGRNSPAPARVTFSITLTLALLPLWPVVPVDFTNLPQEAWRLLGRLLSEAALGLAIGLVLALLSDSFLIAAQILGLQAGYSYASTIDPNSEADSSVLLVLAQLGGWLLFLAFGLDRHVIRTLARSLEAHPAGSFWFTPEARASVLEFGSTVLSVGLRLALPVVALMLLVDIAFAVMGKLHAQLQMLSLAFPIKMLVTLIILAASFRVYPGVYETVGAKAVEAIARIAGG